MLEPCMANRMSLWGRYGALCWAAWFCVISGFGQRGSGAEQEGDTGTGVFLTNIKQLVEKNEGLVSLIKLEYVVRFTHSNPEEQQRKLELLASSGERRRKPRRAVPVTHRSGVWAQDDVKQYQMENLWYADGWKDPRNSLRAVDGEVYKYGVMPDLMQGAIDRIEEFPYRVVAPLRFGLRVLTGQYALREIFAFENSSVRGEEVIDGRGTYVVDAMFPGGRYYIRAWIDQEAGVPLRVEYYNKHFSSVDRKLLGEIKDIQLHRLPNGGWFPIKGTRSVYFSDETVYERLEVDVNSVTIEREDIPDSLFTFEFPEGARIYNAITGITTKAGRVEDRKLESIIDESIEALDFDASPTKMSSSEQTKQEAENSQQIPQKQPVNEPTLSENENTTGALADVNPATVRGYSIVWILLPAFLAAFALTIIILMFRSPSGNTVRRDVK